MRASAFCLLYPFAVLLALTAIGYAVYALVSKFTGRRARRLERVARGRCPRCEYNLTGLQQPRCPECGERWDDLFAA